MENNPLESPTIIGRAVSERVEEIKIEEKVEYFDLTSEASVERVHIFDKPQKRVVSIIHFASPQNKIAVASNDGTIRILEDSDPFGHLQTLDAHNSRDVNDLVKWNEEIFLSCGSDGEILSFSIDSYVLRNKFEHFKKNEDIIRMLNLNNGISFLAASRDQIIVINYETKRIMKTLSHIRVDNFLNLRISQFNPNCFYLNTCEAQDTQYGGNEKIKMINYDSDKVMKEYTKHKNYTYGIEVYQQKEKMREILVSCGYDHKVYFYDTETTELIHVMNLGEYLYSVKCFENQFLVVGNFFGKFYLFELVDFYNKQKQQQKKENKNKNLCYIKKFEAHKSDLVFDFEMVRKKGNLQGSPVLLFSCGDHLSVSRIDGLKFKSSRMERLAELDLKERVMFLRENLEDVFFEGVKEMVELKVKDLVINVFRVFC